MDLREPENLDMFIEGSGFYPQTFQMKYKRLHTKAIQNVDGILVIEKI
jgi:hypothetical protein